MSSKSIILTPESDISHINLTDTYWSFPYLYKDNRFWVVMWDADEESLYSNHGTVDGKVQQDMIDTTPKGGKTVGEQAFQEASHRYTLKLREGFHLEDEKAEFDPEPMLAKTYLPTRELAKLKAKGEKKKATDVMIEQFPVMVQAKFDGIRILAKRMSDGRIRFRSRRNNEFAHMTAMKNEVRHLLELLPAHSEIDGEAYTEDLPFEKISGIARRKTKDPNEDKLRLFIFDVILPENRPYEDRYQILQNVFEQANRRHGLGHLCLVVSHLARNEDEIQQYHEQFTQRGYEGTMVRVLSNGARPGSKQYDLSLYAADKRSNGLLKYKDFLDSEMKIIDVEEGVGGESGLAMIRVLNPFAKTEAARTVLVRPKSSFEQRREWFKNKNKIIGKLITIRYQEITPDGNLRFPVAIAIRDYE